MASLFVIIIALFLWSGFICAISFMESWLKFRADGLTMPVGLSIGKLVFSALNKVEWVFALLIIIMFFLNRTEINFLHYAYFSIVAAILILQTAWLLPGLNNRAKQIISGKALPSSGLHWYFIIAEFVKLLLLFLFGTGLLRSIIQQN